MRSRDFPAVPGGYPFPRLELEALARWRRDDVFRRSLALPAPRGEWVFYEGPPTANNVPHVGHVVTRVMKDLFPRYRTMRGYHVARKAGWDTHGLAVEIEVEKRLGFSGKQQIEAYGIAEFNAACLESVHTYERQWRAMTERVGYWTDLDDAYYTYSNEYIESVWWALAQLWEQGLLVQDYKIQPYCARCGTTLSSHEVAQNYKDADDPSIWVLFPARQGQRVAPLDGPPLALGPETKLVAWTTTPWTVLAHVALVVHPDLVYRVVEHPTRPGERLLFGDALEKPVPLEVEVDGKRKKLDLRELPALARVRGLYLEGVRYDRPYPIALAAAERTWDEPHPLFADAPPGDDQGWRVTLGEYATVADGTGIVHTAPPYGEDDYKTGLTYSLPIFRTVTTEGKIAALPGLEPFAGRWFKEADPLIVRDLKQRGLLLHGERYQHNYPFCWRCDSPLLYYASLSWFIRTTLRRDELVAKNREIDWHPPAIGEGRFGNWLENVVDWALSRRRYWGTPLPIWRCDDCGVFAVIGSYAELFARGGEPLPDNVYDREQFDPHRPFIDERSWPCGAEGCGGTMRRVEEVIDAWFDSGAMPFAQHHYPFERSGFNPDPRHGELHGFPADWISEAVDQTRGWFYTLHVLGVLLFDSVAYRSCVVLGHVNDEQGRKMSKRLGNVVEPMAVIEATGADALRWYFYINNPEQPSRFSATLVREAAQRFLLPLWNALSFFTIYANLDGWWPGGPPLGVAARPELDRWILLRLDELVEATTAAMEAVDATAAARLLESFVDDLTNWYIRRSRARFWGADAGSPEKEAAYQTLYEVLTTLSRLLAPFTPFLADVLHEHLVRSQDEGAVDSVHLLPWPEPRGHRHQLGAEAGDLVQRMRMVQQVVALGRAARNTHELKTRQPLAGVTLVSRDEQRVFAWLAGAGGELVKDELNVKQIRFAENRGDFVRHEVRPNFRLLGKRLGAQMPKVKAALEAADGDALAAELEERGAVTLTVDGQPVELSRDELEVRLEEKPGLATAGDRELLVALDTALTPELVAEGWAREMVHRIQAARKEADLDYADRIRVRYHAAPELAAALAAHREWIASETLALALEETEDGSGLSPAPIDGRDFALRIDRV
ncbi:MAG TPA: isoleucine--tRNA ligase [Thermoanaerobaculia bacterium]|nr:isoleucine--tRNA ligase [Thermoanaerobaculia bacterium]